VLEIDSTSAAKIADDDDEEDGDNIVADADEEVASFETTAVSVKATLLNDGDTDDEDDERLFTEDGENSSCVRR
jgi:hypothetical protein